MRMTLEEIIEDSLLNGYDFQELISNLNKNKRNIREYLYGYTLSKDKFQYLETMAKNKVINCDRIYCFENELKEYLRKIEAMPHSKILSGFYTTKDIEADDGLLYDMSVFRIILIDADTCSAFVKEIEYIDYGFEEDLAVYHAEINFERAKKEIETNGDVSLFNNIEVYCSAFLAEEEINLD